MKPTKITIRIESWACAQLQATPLRYEVFVLEQNVPAELEMDEIDRDCDHALAFIDSEPRDNRIAIATGRLLPDGHIGRMAVQLAWRGKGVGRQVLHALVERARERGLREVVLHAQTQATAFYAKSGFTAYGDEFFEAGISHRAMRRLL